MLGGELVEHPARHHRPLHPLPQVCPLWVSATSFYQCDQNFEMFRRPREITEEFSAGMAILNLLARYSFNFQTSFTSLLTFFSIYSNFACSLIPLICKIIGLSIFALYLYQLFRLFDFQTFSRGPSTFALWKEWGVRGGGGGAWPVSVGEVQHPLLRLI